MDPYEKKIIDLIDENADRIISFARDVAKSGEASFFEFETARKVKEFLESLGLPVKFGIAVTGVKAETSGKRGPTVGIIGELDGIRCPAHPQAVPDTGISHACGHNAQMAIMLGAAIALSDESVSDRLFGNVAFLAIPAEEHVDSEVCDSLLEQGKLSIPSGKAEWVYLGELDDVDIAITTHVHMVPSNSDLLLGNNASTGTIGKKITIHGKAAHAAAAPHLAVNALNAASLGLSALGMLRETFREKDFVRVHPIIKKGGTAVNVVPDEVIIETMVRAGNIEAMLETDRKVDTAFTCSAAALGASCEIKNYIGKLPVIETPPCRALSDAARILSDKADISDIAPNVQNAASTDVGDLTHIMPVINFSHGGFEGALHSADFKICDEYKAYILPAKLAALTVYNLLKDNAENADELIKSFKPKLSRADYIKYAIDLTK
ncbi:MAG: amidohydrolase [Clostridiales bacterium]|nr:amidohydrolase [Clostridiales bacterium]